MVPTLTSHNQPLCSPPFKLGWNVILTLVLSACGSEGFKLKNSSLKALGVSCNSSINTRLEWKWCARNVVSGSSIQEVCYGQAIQDSKIQPAVRLISVINNSEECWMGAGTSQEVTAGPSCDQEFKREYKIVVGPNTLTDITDCIKAGEVIRIGGSLGPARSEFSATRP